MTTSLLKITTNSSTIRNYGSVGVLMARVLTGAEVDEVMAECRANGEVLEYTEGPEFFWQMPLLLGCGYGREIQLRPGLWLNIRDYKKCQTHVYRGPQHQTMPLTLAFYISGGARVDNSGLPIVEEEVAGKSYLYYLSNTFESEEFPATTHMIAQLILQAKRSLTITM